MNQSQRDMMYMRRCLQLAANGMGHTAPNPMVGCVIVKDGKVVGEGYHQRCGGYHAERNAILSLQGRERQSALEGATLYVNLEPCSHYGKTPPCADLIVESGVRRVVCCNDDPNPLVAGKGFAKLEAAGIEVVRHVMEEVGRELNRRFFTYMEQRRPYVILKWAESADGFMAPQGNKKYWISDSYQTIMSHKMRAMEAAILVGSETYLADRPQLSARLYAGEQPLPVVLDRRGRLSDVPEHWLHLRCESIDEVMRILFERKVQSLIVEGGRQILDAFIAARLYDEVIVFRGMGLLHAGLRAPSIPAVSKNRVHII